MSIINILNLVFLLSSNFLNIGSSYSNFPAGSCRSQQCFDNSPYVLEPIMTYSGNENIMCFSINKNVCKENSYCCNRLKDVLEKIVFKTEADCYGSVDNVKINNIRKGGGVYFDNYTGFAELRITALRLNYYTSDKIVCVSLKKPCDTINKFCGKFNCLYSIYDPFTHDCCPVCESKLEKIVIIEQSEPLPSPIPSPIPNPISPISPIPSPKPSPIIKMMPPDFPDFPYIPYIPQYPDYPGAPSIPGSPGVPPSMPSVPSVPSVPSIPSLPPDIPLEKDSVHLRIIIKAPTLDSIYVQNKLCLFLANSFSTDCKIVFTSTTGIYYGIHIYNNYAFNDLRYVLQLEMDDFTTSNVLLCGSTIVLSSEDGSSYVVRYSASKKTCSLM